MSRPICPRESETLAASRRGRLDATIAAHLESCADCGRAVALDRTLALLSDAADAGPFPSAEAVRLEALLVVERRRLARREAARFGLHAVAFAVCVLLLAALWYLDFRPGAPSFWLAGAAPLGATVAVTASMWNLVRAVDETTVPS